MDIRRRLTLMVGLILTGTVLVTILATLPMVEW
jgi:hypothetical protein